MSESEWTQQDGTLSHKNACKELGLTEEEVINAIKQGRLQYRQNVAHGNPYFRLLRSEVQALALELHGPNGVKELEIAYKLKKVNTEINSLKRKLSSLEKQKIGLIETQRKIKA